MIHLQNASVALGAVMSPIGLSPQAPLAHADAAHLLLFDREVLHELLGLISFVLISFLIQRTFFGFEVSILKMNSLPWVVDLLLDLFIDQVLDARILNSSLVLRAAACIDALQVYSPNGASGFLVLLLDQVPLCVFRDVPWRGRHG